MRMTGKMPRALIAAAVLTVGVAVGFPQTAEAQRRGGGHRGGGVVVVGGHYAYPGFYGYPGFGWGFGYPFWSMYGPYPPAFYGPEGGLDRGLALVNGFGGIKLEVKPGQAEVWVDGKYLGEARDFDGYPSYLWLKEGAHRLTVYKGGYAKFEREVEIQPGVARGLKIRLDKGASTPATPPEGGPGQKEMSTPAPKPPEGGIT
jgi:hypothetical protein